jgi:uncharacterized membrane protein YidH (DUF202 family)
MSTGPAATAADDDASPGLQSERTALAWTRTALTAAVAALVVTRFGIVRHDAALTAGGIVLLLGAGAVGLTGRLRHEAIRAAVAERRSPVSLTAIRLLTALVMACAVVAVAAIVS